MFPSTKSQPPNPPCSLRHVSRNHQLQYQVLNETQLVQPILSPNVTVDGKPLNDSTLIQLTKTGNETDPGQIQALNPDLKPFFSRGGKLLMYVGGADTLIPTNSTMRYYKSVQRALGNTTSSLQLYVIEGMGHCSGGVSAYNFGGADQASTVVGGKGQSSQFDAKHDLVLAMRAWRENGTRPEVLVGAKYINNNISQGVSLSREMPEEQEVSRVGIDADKYVCLRSNSHANSALGRWSDGTKDQVIPTTKQVLNVRCDLLSRRLGSIEALASPCCHIEVFDHY